MHWLEPAGKRIATCVLSVGVAVGLSVAGCDLQAISPYVAPDAVAKDPARLERLRSDPMYGVPYPNSKELRRVEERSRGWGEGAELPPRIVSYVGSADTEWDIINFFVRAATSAGWRTYVGPGKITTDIKLGVILRKDATGDLIIKVYEPDRLNALLGDAKLASEPHKSVVEVAFYATSIPPPWKR